jgi:aldehyde:ferredoxin oxidoreductase
MIEAIRKIAYREGLGDLLAEGTRRMARRIGRGSEAFAMQVKGLELGGYDPRGLQGEGLSMATSERGGCHHFGGYLVYAETSGQADNRATAGKAALTRQARMRTILNDSITHCSFLVRSAALGLDALTRALGLATGLDFTPQHLETMALRVLTLERCLNLREGLTRADDTLPPRLLQEPLPDGPNRGEVNRLHEMLEDFYAACGWDPATGVPTRATLEGLGLPAAAGRPGAPGGR